MKRLFCFLTALLLLASLVLPAAAAETPETCIYDLAGLLTKEECRTLEQQAQEISRAQQCAVYFLTVEDYRDYAGGSIFDAGMRIYQANDLGMGSDRDGVLLLLSMDDRDYCLLAHGFGDTALTDYGKDSVSEAFLDNFADNDWYGGCGDYLSRTEELLSQARAGRIYDKGSWITGGALWGWSLGLALVVALIVCLCQRAAMKKRVVPQAGALGYLESGGADITRRTDRFTHTTEIRHKIETNSNSGSSGGGHSHSGGYSGKSGKF